MDIQGINPTSLEGSIQKSVDVCLSVNSSLQFSKPGLLLVSTALKFMASLQYCLVLLPALFDILFALKGLILLYPSFMFELYIHKKKHFLGL